MFMRRPVITALVTVTLTGACAEDPEADLDSTSDELRGFVSYANPEIGIVAEGSSVNALGRQCTGTAVAPNVVLTAGHCTFANWFYTVENPLAVRRFAVRQRWAHPTEDIGLLWIREPIPWTRPMEEHGPVGATAALVGFGGNDCDLNSRGEWAYNRGLGTKRLAFFTTVASGQINAAIVCPGDSGGPVVDWADGRVFGVMASSNGTRPGDSAWFTATNRPGVWASLQFLVYVWQSESNAGR
jgi:hypothetical protein